MALEIVLNKLVDIILFPPGINFLLLIVSYFTFKKNRKIAWFLSALSLSSLYILSMIVVSNWLIANLQSEYALSPTQVKKIAVQQRDDLAIVVLSGGRLSLAPEYGDIDTVNSATLQRIQYAAWLQKKTNLPILVSGGSVFDQATAEAVLMNQTMVSAFNIAPKWIEPNSKNTAESAQFSVKILTDNHITEILLVTHAIHMQRAKLAFEKAEIKVIAAPTVFESQQNNWNAYFPSAEGLYNSQLALHERVGRFWYSLR